MLRSCFADRERRHRLRRGVRVRTGRRTTQATDTWPGCAREMRSIPRAKHKGEKGQLPPPPGPREAVHAGAFESSRLTHEPY